MNLFIFYPKLFNVPSKFKRKLDRIISEKTPESVVFLHDQNALIKSYFGNINSKVCMQEIDKIDDFPDITHAIIFDDGEEFADELQQLSAKNIPFRLVNIKLTRVINITRETEFKGQQDNEKYEYIGRGSYWGNPYSMFEDGDDRDEVIRKFRYDFDYEKFPHIDKQEVFKLSGKRLGCFCKPASCHGDVLADFLNSWDDGK
ncbi:MAG: DUF4326 domain-containing protein [Paraglaciecola sp.]|nr:DUF4326 domain-containing protein [Paraglaciecola sp.]